MDPKDKLGCGACGVQSVLGPARMVSDVGWAELQEEGLVGFFLDFARAAELLWLLADVVLLAWLLGLPRGAAVDFSLQTVALYAVVAVGKALVPSAWRFHEAGFLDGYAALASLGVLALAVPAKNDARRRKNSPLLLSAFHCFERCGAARGGGSSARSCSRAQA